MISDPATDGPDGTAAAAVLELLPELPPALALPLELRPLPEVSILQPASARVAAVSTVAVNRAEREASTRRGSMGFPFWRPDRGVRRIARAIPATRKVSQVLVFTPSRGQRAGHDHRCDHGPGQIIPDRGAGRAGDAG